MYATLSETNPASLHLKMDGWNTIPIVSFWEVAYFQVLLLLVSGRVKTFKKQPRLGSYVVKPLGLWSFKGLEAIRLL